MVGLAVFWFQRVKLFKVTSYHHRAASGAKLDSKEGNS